MHAGNSSRGRAQIVCDFDGLTVALTDQTDNVFLFKILFDGVSDPIGAYVMNTLSRLPSPSPILDKSITVLDNLVAASSVSYDLAVLADIQNVNSVPTSRDDARQRHRPQSRRR